MPNSAALPAANTVGQIAARLGVDKDRVQYLIRARSILPVARAGHFRVFSEEAVELIGREIQAIEDRKAGA